MYGAVNLKLIGVLAAAVVLFVAGWIGNGWRWESKYVSMQKAHADAIIESNRQARRQEQIMQSNSLATSVADCSLCQVLMNCSSLILCGTGAPCYSRLKYRHRNNHPLRDHQRLRVVVMRERLTYSDVCLGFF